MRVPVLGSGSIDMLKSSDDGTTRATEADIMVCLCHLSHGVSTKYQFQMLRVAELKTWVSDHRIVSSGTKKNGTFFFLDKCSDWTVTDKFCRPC